MKKILSLMTIIGIALTGVAGAGTNVNADITGSVTWTKANSPYHLKKQIYVVSGATLTIEAGVVVASFVPDQGSLGGLFYPVAPFRIPPWRNQMRFVR